MTDQLAGEAYHQYYVAAKRRVSSNKLIQEFNSLEDVETAFKSGKINTIFEVQTLLELVDEDPSLAVMFVNQWTEESGLVNSKKALNSNKERLQESIDNEDTGLFTAEDWRRAVQLGIITKEELHDKLKAKVRLS